MLKKLLRYEFKSVSRILVPAVLGTIALALLTSILFTINYRSLSSRAETAIDGGIAVDISSNIFSVVITTLLIFSTIAIFASIFVIGFILLQRYYKNFFCDEGYLTFTLPVKTSEHLTAKLISGVVWMLLGGITVLISVFMLVTIGTAESGQIINTELLQKIGDALSTVFKTVGTGNGIAYTIEILILIIVECVAQILYFYLAITIGSIIAKKHKIIASAGVYLGINAAAGTIMNIAVSLIFGNYNSYTNNDLSFLTNSSHLFFILLIVLFSAFSVAAFIITDYLLSKKLNLE